MQATELIRELLEVLEASSQGFCHDCKRATSRHKPNCRYVAAVKAARKFLATPPVVDIQSWTVEQSQQFVETPTRKPRVWIDGQEVPCDSVKIDWQFDFPVFNDAPGSVAKENH